MCIVYDVILWIPNLVFLFQQPAQPGNSVTHGVSKRYWVDSSMGDAMAMLIFTGTFIAAKVEVRPGMDGEEGTICYQENDPLDAFSLPHHIANLERYTERTCRDLFKNIVERVQILHDSSVAHRNLQPDNILVQSNVRRVLSSNTSLTLPFVSRTLWQ